MAKKKPLNERQKRFAKQYVITLNGTQAAIAAGYSPNGADVQAIRLLADDRIMKLVVEGCEARSKNAEVSAEYVLTNLKSIVERCLQQVPVLAADGKETGEFRFNAAGANRALELLGRFLAMWVDRVDLTAGKNLSDVILEAAAKRAMEGRLSGETGAEASETPTEH